jgi:puromycin-sensitive aminopeptidase
MRASLRETGVAKGDAAKVKPGATRRATMRRVRSERMRGAYRLPGDVRPVAADLHVAVDPVQGDTFTGDVLHHVTLARARRTLELHAVGLTVTRAHAEVGDKIVRGRVQTRPDRETIDVVLAEPLPAGDATLVLEFKGKLSTDLRGFYAARSGERKYAFTQLESTEARRFFPCFDEPALKARFGISVTTAHANTVISNNPVEKIVPREGGKKTVVFAQTPPLSTYLLALAVGELVASEPVHCGETEIRIWHVPGKESLTAFSLEAARETLARLETYFDLPYPYEKLDLVAVPEFEAGAMENAGAVFFRETLLLVDPARTTTLELKRVAEVICHELAHMWYGDLVTMAWWDDLWLNEAFATWMAYQVVDAWKPEWRMWSTFQHDRAAALGMDALDSTHPIYIEVRSPSEATENFDLITYEKGASVVRMIERYLGAEVFRAGVRKYIREHQESNTVAADLWNALADASGQDVEPIMRAWIEQPGFPLLRLERVQRGDAQVVRYRQERFRPNADKPAKDATKRWPIPWLGRAGTAVGSRTVRQLLARSRGEFALEGEPARFLYGNAEEAGFVRPLHTAAELTSLVQHLRLLSGVERQGLVGHQWAALRAGHAELGSFLEVALALGNENDPDVLAALRPALEGCARSARRTLGPAAEHQIRARVAQAFSPALNALGFDPGAKDDEDRRRLRALLFTLVGDVGESTEVRAKAAELVSAYLGDRTSVEPELAATATTIAASCGDAALYERYLAAQASAATPLEQRRLLMALGEFRTRELVQRTLARNLTDAVSAQDVGILLAAMMGNPSAAHATWEFFKRRFKALRKKLPPALVARPIEASAALATREARRDIAAFFKANPVPTATRAVKKAIEQIDLTCAFDARVKPQLARWLETAPPRGL